jgi:hypothetical protein
MCHLLQTKFNILMYMVSFICTYILVDMARQFLWDLLVTRGTLLFCLQKHV